MGIIHFRKQIYLTISATVFPCMVVKLERDVDRMLANGMMYRAPGMAFYNIYENIFYVFAGGMM